MEDAGAYNASHDGNAKINAGWPVILHKPVPMLLICSQLNAQPHSMQNSQMINRLLATLAKPKIEENGAGINYVRTNDMVSVQLTPAPALALQP